MGRQREHQGQAESALRQFQSRYHPDKNPVITNLFEELFKVITQEARMMDGHLGLAEGVTENSGGAVGAALACRVRDGDVVARRVKRRGVSPPHHPPTSASRRVHPL